MTLIAILGVAFMCGIGIAVVDGMRNRESAPVAPGRGRAYIDEERVGDVRDGEIAEESTDLPLARGRSIHAQRVIEHHRRLGPGQS